MKQKGPLERGLKDQEGLNYRVLVFFWWEEGEKTQPYKGRRGIKDQEGLNGVDDGWAG